MEIQARKYQITARHSWILPGPVVGDNNTESLTKRQKSRMIYEKGDNAIGVCFWLLFLSVQLGVLFDAAMSNLPAS